MSSARDAIVQHCHTMRYHTALSAGRGVAEIVKAARIERKGRDVYVMGAANVGKSAFVR